MLAVGTMIDTGNVEGFEIIDGILGKRDSGRDHEGICGQRKAGRQAD